MRAPKKAETVAKMSMEFTPAKSISTPAKEGTDHTAKSIGHGKICLSFDGIFGFHDRIYIVDRGGSHKSPSKHLKNLYSIIDGDPRCQKRSKRFQHEENTRQYESEYHSGFFDDIAKRNKVGSSHIAAIADAVPISELPPPLPCAI